MSLTHKQLILLLETLCFVVLPLGIVLLNPALFHFRIPIMVIAFCYVFLRARQLRVTSKSLGFIRTSKAEIIELLPKVTFFALATIVIKILLPGTFILPFFVHELHIIPGYVYLLIYIFLSVPLQEILFRSFLISRLEHVSHNPYFLILYSAVVFALTHVPTHNMFMILGSFILGIWSAHHFIKYRNLEGIFFIHATLGGLFLLLCLIWLNIFNFFVKVISNFVCGYKRRQPFSFFYFC